MIQQNFLSPIGFQFSIHRLPNTSFFVQTADIPSVEMISPTDVATPFQYIRLPADKITYGNLNITIRMDEGLNSYLEILNWMTGLTKPDSYNEYANLKASSDGLYSDATLVILDGKGNPSTAFSFNQIFPERISAIRMDTTLTDVNYVTADISFIHNGFTVSKI